VWLPASAGSATLQHCRRKHRALCTKQSNPAFVTYNPSMRSRRSGQVCGLVIGVIVATFLASGANAQPSSPARKSQAPTKPFTAARTPWGDPDISGVFTNNDESLIPFERPAQFDGRRLEEISDSELAALRTERSDERVEADRQRWELRSPLHWFENHFPKNSRAWLISDPPDGKVPPQTDEARERAAARAAARGGRGPADSYEDRSLYDRCITRGLPGSMMPAIYGNAYQIHQGPGYVAIHYEMVNETRVIPLDGRPHVGHTIQMYLGDARGRWDGSTLVVETTNFTDKTPYRGSSEYLRMVERFTPVSPEVVEWSVTFNDPHTWTRPWTFAMSLTKKDDSQRPYEYACHEGNLGLDAILRAGRADDKTAGDAARPSTTNRD
jgi:hypothetical protein